MPQVRSLAGIVRFGLSGCEIISGLSVIQEIEKEFVFMIACSIRVAVSAERSRARIVKAGIPVPERMLRIIAGAVFEYLLSVLHLVVQYHGLGRIARCPAVEIHHGVEKLCLFRRIGSGIRVRYEVFGPYQFRGMYVLPVAVVGIIKGICPVHIGPVDYGLGCLVGAFPLALEIIPASEYAALRKFRIVEQR